jgi:hypothetical protein
VGVPKQIREARSAALEEQIREWQAAKQLLLKLKSVRFPESPTPEQEAVQRFILNRLLDLSEGRCSPATASVQLAALRTLADEAFGPLTKKVDVTQRVTLEALVLGSLKPAASAAGARVVEVEVESQKPALPGLNPGPSGQSPASAEAETMQPQPASFRMPVRRRRRLAPLPPEATGKGGSGGGGTPQTPAPARPPGTPSPDTGQI